jgi:hypothetical protein
MNKYIWVAGFFLLIVFSSYIIKFYWILDLPFSNDQAVWGQLGDFIGGLLNPIFGFISIILLIQSLKLQNESNRKLIEQINDSKKSEKLKSFENLFFNLIEIKRGYFSQFEIEFDTPQGIKKFSGNIAVDKLEVVIQHLKKSGKTEDEIRELLMDFNDKHNIFSQVRCFYVIVKLIDDQLVVMNGFNGEDRKSYYKLLINFTEFSHLRLVIMSMQFLDFESTRYLNNNSEFKAVLNELNLVLSPY